MSAAKIHIWPLYPANRYERTTLIIGLLAAAITLFVELGGAVLPRSINLALDFLNEGFSLFFPATLYFLFAIFIVPIKFFSYEFKQIIITTLFVMTTYVSFLYMGRYIGLKPTRNRFRNLLGFYLAISVAMIVLIKLVSLMS